MVRSDGLGVWREGEATVAFCLECDRGSEQLSRLDKKAGDYARLEAAWASPSGCSSSSRGRGAKPAHGAPVPPGSGGRHDHPPEARAATCSRQGDDHFEVAS